ncbi:MAG: ankyrin repeat domain-containing protein [Dechloromonas sp.]|nr:MAG: ankyrin repeat domain-containing protein [Dechloromonas sp.]
MRAAKEGRLDIVEELLALGVDIAVTNADGCNALWLACYNGSHAIIERLIAAGIDIDLQNGNGASCLMYVSSNSKPDLVKLLLEKGANPKLKNFDDFSALDLAASVDCLKLLRRLACHAGCRVILRYFVYRDRPMAILRCNKCGLLRRTRRRPCRTERRLPKVPPKVRLFFIERLRLFRCAAELIASNRRPRLRTNASRAATAARLPWQYRSTCDGNHPTETGGTTMSSGAS